MGTTRDAIRSQDGLELAYTAVIEGYKYILTDGLASQAVAAWAGTSWEDALPGLQVSGTLSQSLKPWSNELNVPRLTINMVADDNDTFAVDMFRAVPNVRSDLTVGFDTSTSGSGGFNMTIRGADQFAAVDTVYVGNEAFEVTGTPSGNTIPVAPSGAGVLHPFDDGSGSNRFPGPHRVVGQTSVGAGDVRAPIYVSDVPTTWIGKKIAVYAHRVINQVFDELEEAELVFAGTLSRISEVEAGTSIECEGITKAIEEAQCLQNQWIGRPKKGRYFQDGEYLRVTYYREHSNTGDGEGAAAALFTCGVDFDPGRYEVEEYASLLVAHLDTDTTVGRAGSAFSLVWGVGLSSVNDGLRFQISAKAAASEVTRINVNTLSPSLLTFLGFNETGEASPNGHYGVGSAFEGEASQYAYLTAPSPALKYEGIGLTPLGSSADQRIEFESTDGVFYDHTEWLPPEASPHIGEGEQWSFYTIGDEILFLGRRDSENQISQIFTDVSIAKDTQGDIGKISSFHAGSDKDLVVKQIFFAVGSFRQIITNLFASIDGAGVNTEAYDVFPFGAGIPYSLLGSSFLDSLRSLEQSSANDSLAVVIEEPTRLWDVIRSDFALRMAGIVFKDGGLRAVQLSVPNASRVDHTLTESNKGDDRRTASEQTDEFQVTTLKILYNRRPLSSGSKEYGDERIVRSIAGYEGSGGTGKTITIKARNSYAGQESSGSSVEDLADMITARFMPTFSKPLRRWKRSVNHNLFHIAPGDTVNVAEDDTVRDPTTGKRGVSNRPGTVLSHSYSPGISSGGQTMFGEVEVLHTEEDRTFPVCPSAEAAQVTSGTYAAGWSSSTLDLAVNQRSFSDASEPTDGESFEAGDIVRVLEKDPDSASAPDSFTDTVAGVGTVDLGGTTYDRIRLTSGFGSGGRAAHSSAKAYYITFADFDEVNEDQKLNAFLADEGDGKILDVAEPNLVADEAVVRSEDADVDLLPSLLDEVHYEDGSPMTSLFVRDNIRLANNVINYRTAPSSPMFYHDPAGYTASTASENDYVAFLTFPFYFGGDAYAGGLRRALKVAAQFRSTTGALPFSTIRVTSSTKPPGGDDFDNVLFRTPYQQITFRDIANTSWVQSDTKDLLIVPSYQNPDFTWITVEANDNTVFRGLNELRLGPLE